MQQLPPSYPVANRTNTMAVISLATGVASWIVIPLIGGVVAVVTGHIARREIRQTGEQGDGLAIAGLVLGYLHLATVVLVLVILAIVFLGVFALVVNGQPSNVTVSPSG